LRAAQVERRLAAILATDVAGYSRLMERDEAGTLARLRTLRRDLIDPKIAEHKGRIVKTTGDGLLVEFPSVVEAVACAIATQREMAARSNATAADERIQFRIGINTGDVIVEDGDIHGDGVNIAARLEGIAEPGGVCVSGIVHDQVQGRVDCAFADIGEQSLKNIARPIRVYRISLGEAAAAPGKASLPLPEKPSLAVLPFQNLSGDPEQDYFADGMVEETITALSRIPWLFVIARNSTFTYKGKAVDVKRVSRELGVRYVLEGSCMAARRRVGHVRSWSRGQIDDCLHQPAPGVHPVPHDGITVRQAARMQTFQDDFVFEGDLMAAGEQVGNAVPVHLGIALIEHIKPLIIRAREARSTDGEPEKRRAA
jgi:adenylate cyclase